MTLQDMTGIEAWILKALQKAGVTIITGIATLSAGLLWRRFLGPLIQNFFWSGRCLESSYTGEFTQLSTGTVVNDHIEVKQWAGRVWGTMTFPKGIAKKYKFEARLEDGILRGTVDGFDQKSPSRASFLLAVGVGSKELTGWCIEPIDGKVVSYEYKWRSTTP